MPTAIRVLKSFKTLIAFGAVIVCGLRLSAQEARPLQSPASDAKVEELQRTVSELEKQVAELKSQMTAMRASVVAANSSGTQAPNMQSHTVSDLDVPGGGMVE